MNLKIHHVAFAVRDMDESIAWYKNAFDAEVVERYTKNNREIVHLKMGDVRLELFCSGAATEALPDYRKTLASDLQTLGTKHVCIATEDLDALIEKLKKQNVKFATQLDTAGFGGRFIFIEDLNGILIELYQT